MTRTTFKNADEAYEYFYKEIIKNGSYFAGTKALFNVGFYLNNPLDNAIHSEVRNWNHEYAQAEWQWYLSGDRNIAKLGELYGKIPQIWEHMADEDGNVNSNYGWQWQRNDQIDRVVNILLTQPHTRQAAISIYDCKEHKSYGTDTPCTYAVQFTLINGHLNMCVTMRSNDLWYGFCNDQYCFSRLQEMISQRIRKPIGTYYHFAHNLHLYNKHIPQ